MKKAFTPLHPESPVFQNGDEGKIKIKLSGKPCPVTRPLCNGTSPLERGVTGFTLVETIVVVAIFLLLFGSILAFLSTSDRSLQTGQDKLLIQQQARRGMDEIARLLRQSNPDWVIGEVHYPVVITESGSRIDFYQPLFDAAGQIITLKRVTFKINPDNPKQLLKKEGIQDAVVVANELDSINFVGACAGCSSFTCFSVATDCPILKVQLTTRKKTSFTLTSQISLRNVNTTISGGTEVEEPPEGEF